MTKEQVDKVLKDIYLSTAKAEKLEAYAILIDGLRYTNSSGKCVWEKKHHALSSFSLPIRETVQDMCRATYIRENGRYPSRREYLHFWNEFVDSLIESGRLQIIKLTPEDE